MAIPHFETQIYALVPLSDNNEVRQNEVYLFDGHQEEVINKYKISSNISRVAFLQSSFVVTGFDEVHVVKMQDMKMECFLKTSANVGYCFSICFSKQLSSLSFRSKMLGKRKIMGVLVEKVEK